MKPLKGFSLIELLIVIAIILIIAAIAIPTLLRARIAANESSAVAGVRTIATAQIQYQSAYPNTGFAAAIANLGPTAASGCTTPSSAAACLIDMALVNATNASSPKSGYVYGGAGLPAQYSEGAYPLLNGRTGNRSFCSVEDAVVRVDSTASPNVLTACSNSIPAVP